MNSGYPSELQCVCLSDFNLSDLAAYLADPEDVPIVRTVPTEYGRVISYLLDEHAGCWKGSRRLRLSGPDPKRSHPISRV
jgi:hypothetical protein